MRWISRKNQRFETPLWCDNYGNKAVGVRKMTGVRKLRWRNEYVE